jgi:hypothetical protein
MSAAAHMPRNQRTRIPTDKAAAGVLFCCKQEGRVNHEAAAMKIITKDPAGTKRAQNNNHPKKKRVVHKRPKAKPTRPTGRTRMMMMKPPAFRFPGLALHVSSELALQSS